VPLEEVKHEIVYLWVVRAVDGTLIGETMRTEQMFLLDVLKLLEVHFVVHVALLLVGLLVMLLISHLADSVLPVLHITAENALIEESTFGVFELECVHASALLAMEGLGAISALNRRTLRLAAEARELFFVDEKLQSLADVDPLLSLDAESRVLIKLNAVLMEPERLPNHLGARCILIFAERSNKGLILLLAERADARAV